MEADDCDFDHDRLASCVGKESFESAVLASTVAKRRRRQGKPGEAYKCRYCKKWHIGYRTRWKSKG